MKRVAKDIGDLEYYVNQFESAVEQLHEANEREAFLEAEFGLIMKGLETAYTVANDNIMRCKKLTDFNQAEVKELKDRLTSAWASMVDKPVTITNGVITKSVDMYYVCLSFTLS